MESLEEREERMEHEIGGAMNDYFTKKQMIKFYDFLKKINRMVIWCNIKKNFFQFNDVMYIDGKKFRVCVMNTQLGRFNCDFEEEDRYPVEIMVELPIDTYDSGITNNHIVLKSKGCNLGGMSYRDFVGFIKLYKGWIKNYSVSRYREYHTNTVDISGNRFATELSEEYSLDNIPEDTKRGFFEALTRKFRKIEEEQEQEYNE